MKKLKRWLIMNFLPAWAKEELLTENERLRAQVEKLQREKERLISYIDGIEIGIRAQRRISIYTGEAKK